MSTAPLLRFLACCHLAMPCAQGDDLRVDPRTGDDAGDGRAHPLKSIARAIRLAQPGDTIHLAPGTYAESADLTGKHGQPGRPIVLDGHGATLEGSEPVRAADWEALGGGLHRKTKLLPRMDRAIVSRWFFLWDGAMNRMGRTSKGPSAPLKAPADLASGEWTYVAGEDAFYLRLPPGQDLDAARIRYPARSSAVICSQTGSHLTVRNVTGTHVYNDGFNIHGAQRGLTFENIAAIECGDDGFSAHEDADCRIDGFVSMGNSTGLCDTGTSRTHYRNILIRDCLGYDLFFLGLEHSMEHALIESRAARAVYLQANHLPEGLACSVTLKQVLIRRMADAVPQEIRVSDRTQLHAEGCTFRGLNVTMTPGGSISLTRCLLAGDPRPAVLLWEKSTWRGEGNLYDIASLRVGQTSYTARTFSAFQQWTGSETGTRWEALDSVPPAGLGADEATLRSLEKPRR